MSFAVETDSRSAPVDECSVEGCKTTYGLKVGYCNRHYIRLRKYGDPLAYYGRVRPACSVENCEKKAVGRGLCTGHYQRLLRGRDSDEPLTKRAPIGNSLVRDDKGRKQCRACDHWKPESEFQSRAGRTDGLSERCRLCDQEKIQLRKYNLTADQFHAILKSQGNVCAICGRDNPSSRRWAVDHDHACCPGVESCGKCVRGLLCSPCNGALGAMQDSIERLRNAANYLERNLHVRP